MPDTGTIRACVFDAYGTLFDVHSAVGKHRERLGDQADIISHTWRTKQLEYTWLRSLMDRHVDFWQVTADALDYALDGVASGDPGLRDELLNAYLSLDCYPEVAAVLQCLKAAGLQTAILSNGSPMMLQAAVTSSGIAPWLDHIFSIEEVGIYKPNYRTYRLAVDHLQLSAQQISFQSSNAWDAAGAATFGFHVVWINRFGQCRERLPDGPQAELTSLRDLPPTLGVT